MQANVKESVEYKELEDRYLSLREQYQALKQHCTEQEEKMKIMATKLVRLTSDLKRKEEMENQFNGSIPAATRAIKRRNSDLQQVADDLRQQLATLESKNEMLTNKLKYYRSLEVGNAANQLSKSKLGTSIRNQRPKTPLNRRRPHTATGTNSGGRPKPTQHVGLDLDDDDGEPLLPMATQTMQQPQTMQPQVNDSVIQHLESQHIQDSRMVDTLRCKLNDAEEVINHLREELQDRQSGSRYQALPAPDSAGSSANVGDMLVLQREVRTKSAMVVSLESKYAILETKYLAVKDQHESLLQQLGDVTNMLKSERQQVLKLQHDLRIQQVSYKSVDEYNLMINDLVNEKNLLIQENKRLTTAIVSIRHESRAECEARMTYLEEQLKRLLDTPMERPITADDNSKKQPNVKAAVVSKPVTQQQGMCSHCQELSKEIDDLRILNSDLKQELAKCKKLNDMQSNIIKELESGVSTTSNLSTKMKSGYENKLAEKDRILEIRASRIKALERHLAAGTGVGVPMVMTSPDTMRDVLGIGMTENIIEIKILSVTWLRAGGRMPTLYLSGTFYVYPLLVTSVFGNIDVPEESEINIGCEWPLVVKEEYDLLEYIDTKPMQLELMEVNGVQSRPIARGVASMTELVRRHGDLVSNTVVLTSAENNQQIAVVNFTVRWMFATRGMHNHDCDDDAQSLFSHSMSRESVSEINMLLYKYYVTSM